jgi:hypothetical protein
MKPYFGTLKGPIWPRGSTTFFKVLQDGTAPVTCAQLRQQLEEQHLIHAGDTLHISFKVTVVA